MANVMCPTQPKFLQGFTVRVTQLDNCGNPEFGECAYAASDGYITVTAAPNNADGDEFQQKNAHGVYLTNQRSRPLLNWIDLTVQFREVDYELFSMITGLNTIVNDAGTPETIGLLVTEGEYATGNVAIELWMGTDEGDCGDSELPWYGYNLFPWVVEGTVSEVSEITNGMINFSLMSRTRKGTPWGVGPWDVVLPSAGGDAQPLFNAIPNDTHWANLVTQVPPPDPTCGCATLTSS